MSKYKIGDVVTRLRNHKEGVKATLLEKEMDGYWLVKPFDSKFKSTWDERNFELAEIVESSLYKALNENE